jgi:hypothetical protein
MIIASWGIAMKFVKKVVVAALLLGSSGGQAKIVTIKLTGTVQYLYGVAQPAFYIGQTAKALLRYESTSPGYNFYSGQAVEYYPNAPTVGTLSIGSYSVLLDSARMFVTDNEVGCCGLIDRLIYEDNSPQAAPVGGLAITNLFFNWQATGASGGGVSLPNTTASVLRYGLPTAAIDYSNDPNDNDASDRVQVRFTSIAASVPEPASWAMLVVGFSVVGAATRRRQSFVSDI